jgi:hypothetical protein
MNYAFALALFLLQELGGEGEKMTHLNEWTQLKPNMPPPLILRGVYTYPSPQSLADFRNAIAHQTVEALPFFYLAHNELGKGHVNESIRLSEAGLRKSITVPSLDERLKEIRFRALSLKADREQKEDASVAVPLAQWLGAMATEVRNRLETGKQFQQGLVNQLKTSFELLAV